MSRRGRFDLVGGWGLVWGGGGEGFRSGWRGSSDVFEGGRFDVVGGGASTWLEVALRRVLRGRFDVVGVVASTWLEVRFDVVVRDASTWLQGALRRGWRGGGFDLVGGGAST